jgi:hypothetical protein
MREPPTATVRLAAGEGLIARRPSALLFVPARDPVLVDAFTTSAPGAELQAVASTTVAEGFTVGPFVCLAWGSGVQVMAFGEVAVETDQPSLPMLTGAGSRTWVEHSMPLNGDAVIHVASPEGDVDEATDLAGGVVFAGGFRLELAAAVRTAPSPPPAPAVAEPEAGPVTEAVPRQPAAARPTPPTDPDDPVAALAAIQAAAVGADGEPLVPTGGAPPPPRPADAVPAEAALEPSDPDVTLPPPVSEVLLQAVGDLDGGEQRASLVEAKLCGHGHPNPPAVATCGVCGEFLAPGASSVVTVPRPSLGRLLLDDGELIELDQELLIGRNPDRDVNPDRQGLRRVKLHGDKVSRSHLEVRFQGWEVFVADCRSMNGSFVVPHPGGQVVAIEPGRPQMVEPGATVYFGSRSFTVQGRS